MRTIGRYYSKGIVFINSIVLFSTRRVHHVMFSKIKYLSEDIKGMKR